MKGAFGAVPFLLFSSCWGFCAVGMDLVICRRLPAEPGWTSMNCCCGKDYPPDHQTFGISMPYWNSSHWEVLKQRVLNSELDSVTARGKFSHPLQHKLPPPLVKWMHTLDTVQTNLQVCQVSQECLWQVFVWNIFWRLEHFYAFFMHVHIL